MIAFDVFSYNIVIEACEPSIHSSFLFNMHKQKQQYNHNGNNLTLTKQQSTETKNQSLIIIGFIWKV